MSQHRAFPRVPSVIPSNFIGNEVLSNTAGVVAITQNTLYSASRPYLERGQAVTIDRDSDAEGTPSELIGLPTYLEATTYPPAYQYMAASGPLATVRAPVISSLQLATPHHLVAPILFLPLRATQEETRSTNELYAATGKWLAIFWRKWLLPVILVLAIAGLIGLACKDPQIRIGAYIGSRSCSALIKQGSMPAAAHALRYTIS